MHRRVLSLLLVFSFVLAACGNSIEGKYGVDLYQASCATCHAGNLSGGFGPPLGINSNSALNLTDEQIGNTIRVGPGAMPAFSQLDDEQIASLVEFLRWMQQGE
jgi:mono/diheme cytochrome c family protein